MLLSAIVFGALGLIIGSFLNVLVLRKGVMPITGRSMCPSCGSVIAWYDNVPVLSWIMLRGRCRRCGSGIALQYPLVEALTAALFAPIGAWAALEPLTTVNAVLTLMYLIILALLVAIVVYDMLHTIIPDEWSYAFAGLALLALAVSGKIYFDGTISWGALLAGPLAALPLFVLWLISGGKWMGLGDPKLALGIGWLLGSHTGVVAIFSAFILGSLVLVPLMLYERTVTHKLQADAPGAGLTMKSEVPFGPFLIAACLLFWFANLFGVAIPLYLLGL